MPDTNKDELDPIADAKRDAYLKREYALKEKFKNVPLGSFTVSELGAIMRLQGLMYNSSHQCGIRDEDFEILEKKEI